jgi:hypothetical protein
MLTKLKDRKIERQYLEEDIFSGSICLILRLVENLKNLFDKALHDFTLIKLFVYPIFLLNLGKQLIPVCTDKSPRVSPMLFVLETISIM